MNLRQILVAQGYRLEQIINREAIDTDLPIRIQVSRHGETRLRRAVYHKGVVTLTD